MNNRFTFKDFLTLCLLLAILVTLGLKMVQDDRHWDQLLEINRTLDQQETTLARLQETLRSGVTVRGGDPTGPPTNPGDDAEQGEAVDDPDGPFARYLEAMDAPDFARGGRIVDAFGTTVDNITPLVSSTVYGTTVQSYVLASLGERDPETLTFKPLLARSWDEQVNAEAFEQFIEEKMNEGLSRAEALAHEDCPYAYTVTFRMRPEIRFSDGEPITADDVVFTFNLIMEEGFAPRQAAYYSRVDSVVKEGPRTVTFRFKEPYYNSFALAAGMDVLPAHFYDQYTPDQIKENPGLLMGSGPYQLESPAGWKPGDPIRLQRNPYYWGVKPFPDELVFLQVENPTALLTMFRNGQIDRLSATPEQYVELLKDDQLLQRTRHFEYFPITSGYCYIAWNQDRADVPWFADRRVRRALTMLIDRQLIAEEVHRGYAEIPTGPFNRLSDQHNPDIAPWPHDVQRAKQLLAEAGLRDRDGDGVVEDEQGRPFVFSYTYPAGTPTWDDIARLVRDNLSEAGVAVKLNPIQFAVFVDRLNNKNFDAISLCWGGGIESDPYQIFHSDMIEGEGDNFVSYANPELDRLIERARRAVIEAERMPLWRQVHRILHEDQPYTFLYSRKSLIFIDDRFKNVERVKLGINDRTEWYVPRAEQETRR